MFVINLMEQCGMFLINVQVELRVSWEPDLKKNRGFERKPSELKVCVWEDMGFILLEVVLDWTSYILGVSVRHHSIGSVRPLRIILPLFAQFSRAAVVLSWSHVSFHAARTRQTMGMKQLGCSR